MRTKRASEDCLSSLLLVDLPLVRALADSSRAMNRAYLSHTLNLINWFLLWYSVYLQVLIELWLNNFDFRSRLRLQL